MLARLTKALRLVTVDHTRVLTLFYILRKEFVRIMDLISTMEHRWVGGVRSGINQWSAAVKLTFN